MVLAGLADLRIVRLARRPEEERRRLEHVDADLGRSEVAALLGLAADWDDPQLRIVEAEYVPRTIERQPPRLLVAGQARAERARIVEEERPEPARSAQAAAQALSERPRQLSVPLVAGPAVGQPEH